MDAEAFADANDRAIRTVQTCAVELADVHDDSAGLLVRYPQAIG